MGFIPRGAKWYLADIVIQINVEGDSRTVIHTNTVLVRADSPDEAYEKAIALGKKEEMEYENPQGEIVCNRFRGLRGLDVIYDGELEHGTELRYSEQVGIDEPAIQNWIRSKEQLGVYALIEPSEGPDCRDKGIVADLIDHLPGEGL